MQRHSFIRMTKLSNLKGRIMYISSRAKQEYLYATYDTADKSFWSSLAKCSQDEFKKNGTTGKCIEARELIIALPESFVSYNEEQLLKFFVDEFKAKYNVECVAALHHNKRKTNYHIHLIFSERRLLEETIEKVATRNMFYDETGRHVRTKKEILDEEGDIRPGCKVIKKGDVYEKILFDKKDVQFKQEDFLEKAKVFFTDRINMLVKSPSEKLKVFDKNGVYLPMKKIGKNNPKAEEIIKDNEERSRWNKTVDQALVSEITEEEILDVKKKHITEPVKESIEHIGNEPFLFRVILGKAINVLERLISKVKEKSLQIADSVLENLSGTANMEKNLRNSQLDKYTYNDYKNNGNKGASIQDDDYLDNISVTVELFELPEEPEKPIIDYNVNKLLAIYDELKEIEEEIYAIQKRKNKKELEYSDTPKFNIVKRSAISTEIQNMERSVQELQGELSDKVQSYGFDSVREFMRILKVTTDTVKSYQSDMAKWKEEVSSIQKMNDMIISGEISVGFAIELLNQKGYKARVVKKDVTELLKSVKDDSLKGKLDRAKQRAERNNQNRRKDKQYIRDKKIR